MIPLNIFEISKVSGNGTEAVFEIGPLPKGYGHTLGNMMRRVLLSSIPGSAVTAVKLNGVQHEYSTVSGLKDDILTLLLSIKNIVVYCKTSDPVELSIKVKGKKGQTTEVKVGDIESNPNVEIINKDYVITKLTDDKTFEAKLYISSGIGYSFPNQELRKELNVLPIDSIYSPVKLVSYEVSETRVGQETDLDLLTMTVKTNGAVKPDEAFYTASNILFEMSKHLFENSEVITGKKVVTPVALTTTGEEKVGAQTSSAKPLKVADLNLSTRLSNALLRSGYDDLNKLSGMAEEELANIKGMGQKSLEELLKVLKKHAVKII